MNFINLHIYMYWEFIYFYTGTRWRSWLTHCATSRMVAGSIPDGVIGILHWHNPSGRTMALRSTQPLTEMRTTNISWRVEVAGAYGWQSYHLHVLRVLKSGNLNLLENSRPQERFTFTVLTCEVSMSKNMHLTDYIYWQVQCALAVGINYNAWNNKKLNKRNMTPTSWWNQCFLSLTWNVTT